MSCGANDKKEEITGVEVQNKKPSKKITRKKPPKKNKKAGNTKNSESTTATDADKSSSIEFENSSMVNMLANKISNYAINNGYSTDLCFLVDMSMPSGRNRFFVYDLNKNKIVNAGLVAHGSCNKSYLSTAKFSNLSNSGCSSAGKYKVGEFYRGKYGKSFRLYGLDNSNSNAFSRAVVIHGYDCVPDKEIYPRVLCNSFGCVMVSYKFFDRLSTYISQSNKPIVLWVYGS